MGCSASSSHIHSCGAFFHASNQLVVSPYCGMLGCVNISGKFANESVQASQWYLAVPIVSNCNVADGWAIDWDNLHKPGMPWLREPVVADSSELPSVISEADEGANGAQLIHQVTPRSGFVLDEGDVSRFAREKSKEGRRIIGRKQVDFSEISSSAVTCIVSGVSNY